MKTVRSFYELLFFRIDDIQKNIYVAKLLTQVDTKGKRILNFLSIVIVIHFSFFKLQVLAIEVSGNQVKSKCQKK